MQKCYRLWLISSVTGLRKAHIVGTAADTRLSTIHTTSTAAITQPEKSMSGWMLTFSPSQK